MVVGGNKGTCLPNNATCSGHGFSSTGEPGTWQWVGGVGNAPYEFTSIDSDGHLTNFSTRERPWGLLGGGAYGDDFVVFVNGVSPPMPTYNKFTPGKDWAFTNIQTVGDTP